MPRRARIEPEGPLHLVVDEDVRVVPEDSVRRERILAVGLQVAEHRHLPLSAVALAAVEIRLARAVKPRRGNQRTLYDDVVDKHGQRLHRRHRAGLAAVDSVVHSAQSGLHHEERIVILSVGVLRVGRRGDDPSRALVVRLLVGVERIAHALHLVVALARDRIIALEERLDVEEIDTRGDLDAPVSPERGVRHEVAVGVAVLLPVERIERVHDLPGVAYMVAVRIPVARVRADQELLDVGESVAVEVGVVVVRPDRVIDTRIEAHEDFVGRNLLALEDVRRIEPLEHERLPVARLAEVVLGRIARGSGSGVRRRPDLRLIPEEVLPAVGLAVVVRVVGRWIDKTGARIPEREVETVRLGPFGSVFRKERRLVGLLLLLAQRRLGYDAPVLHVVQAAAEAADLVECLERHCVRDVRRVAREALVAQRVPEAALLPYAGQEVVVGVRVVERAPVVFEWLAEHDLDELALPPAPREREIVGDAVLVDVAEVVLSRELAREDRLDVLRGVRPVLGLLGGQRYRLRRKRLAGHFDHKVADGRVYRIAALVRSDVYPEVQEAVEAAVRLVRIPRRRRRRARAAAVCVYADVVAPVKGPVVEHRRRFVAGILVAECPCRRLRVLAAVPCHHELLGVREHGVGNVDMALAEALQSVGELALRDQRAGRVRLQELGRTHREAPGEGWQRAVLRLDEERDVDIALRIAEVRRELAVSRLSYRHAAVRRVLAPDEGDLYARLGPFCVGVGEVVVDVTRDPPPDGVARRESARDLDAVRRRRRVGRDDVRRKLVDYVHAHLRREIVFIGRRFAGRQHVCRLYLALYREA